MAVVLKRVRGFGGADRLDWSAPIRMRRRVASPKNAPERVHGCLIQMFPSDLLSSVKRQAAPLRVASSYAERSSLPPGPVSPSWHKNHFFCAIAWVSEVFEDEAQRVLRTPCLESPLHGPQQSIGITAWVCSLCSLSRSSRLVRHGSSSNHACSSSVTAASGSRRRRSRFGLGFGCAVGRTSSVCHAVRSAERNVSSDGGCSEAAPGVSAISTSRCWADRMSLRRQRRSKNRPVGGANPGHSAMSASARALSR